MSRYRELREPARFEETEGEWVDFPASPDPDPWATLLKQANRFPPDASRCDSRDAERVGGAVMTSVNVALRGLLVATMAVAMAAYLLLTNSHI
jgi:hypothetical protein